MTRARPTGEPIVVEDVVRPMAAVPSFPGEMTTWERHWWQELWRLPISVTWGLSEGPLVGILAKLYAKVETDGVSPGLAGQIAAICSQLGLNPTSRAHLRVELDRGDPGKGRSRQRFQTVG